MKKDEKDAEANGIHKKWLHKYRFHSTCVATGVLHIGRRFEKCFEDDSVTIMEITTKEDITITSFRDLLLMPLVSGSEDNFFSQMPRLSLEMKTFLVDNSSA